MYKETDKISEEVLNSILDEISIWFEYDYWNDNAKNSLKNEHNLKCLRIVIKEKLDEYIE